MQADLAKTVLRSAKRISVAVLVIVAMLYVAACVLLFFNQRSLLYFPTPESRLSDEPGITVESGGESLRVLTRQHDGPDAVIYFGGNAEDVSTSLFRFSTVLPNQSLYFVNYRGYSGSTGTPTESALFADALAVYDRIRDKYRTISVIGRSLGSGVAVYLAANRKVDKLVLVTPYDSIENVAKKSFPIFPVSLILQDRFDSAQMIPNVDAGSLVILAENDQVIPRANSDALIARFPIDQVTVKVIDRTDHNSIGLSQFYFDEVVGFLK